MERKKFEEEEEMEETEEEEEERKRKRKKSKPPLAGIEIEIYEIAADRAIIFGSVYEMALKSLI